MMHRVNYNGFEMESESAWEWRAIDKKVSVEADYLNTQINANRVDMGSVHVTPAMAIHQIEGVEWITKMPDEDSGDVLFGAEVKAAYDPNQPRDPGGEGGGQWISSVDAEVNRAVADLRDYNARGALERRIIIDADTGERIADAIGEEMVATLDDEGSAAYHAAERLIDLHTHPEEQSLSDLDLAIASSSQTERFGVVLPSGDVHWITKGDRYSSLTYAERTRPMVTGFYNEVLDDPEIWKPGSPNFTVEELIQDAATKTAEKFGMKFTVEKAPARTRAAYNPNQKRGEAGTPDGGRWVKEDGTSSESEALSKLKEENKSTWPKIRVEKIYKNENASRSGELDMKTKMLADEYLEGDRFKELEEVGVDPKNIYPTQRNLTASNLEDVSDVSKETGAFALKKDGKFFILDGHHRVAANILRGDKPIIHVLDLDI